MDNSVKVGHSCLVAGSVKLVRKQPKRVLQSGFGCQGAVCILSEGTKRVGRRLAYI